MKHSLSLWMILLMVVSSVMALPVETTFKEFHPGVFEEIKSASGVWNVLSGQAEISAAYSHSETHCLHLMGGAETRVLFKPATREGTRMTFYAERWTSRTPFQFKVEGWQDGRWVTLYEGSESIRVGARFLSRVDIELPQPPPEKYLFICSAPDNTGLLIDDLTIKTPVDMHLESVLAYQWRVPALINKPANPVLQILVKTTGELQPIKLRSIAVDTLGTTQLGDLESVRLFGTGASENFNDQQPVGIEQDPADTIIFTLDDPVLMDGKNYFWVSYQLKTAADLMHRVQAGCQKVVFDNGTVVKPTRTNVPAPLRIGYALRQAGQDGCHTYRIPGLATTNQGTLIAVYDIRWESSGDLPGNIDIGMSRSVDGGQSWEPMRTIMDMGDSKAFRGDGIGDPAVLVDRATGTVWVAAVWSHGNRGWHGSGPGMTPDETGQLMLVRSDDDGLSWSEPINITQQVKKPEWCFLLQGPGNGITMRGGTLVFAAQYQDQPENGRLPHATILYSRDHGNSWHLGTGVISDTTEAQVVELDDGALMLNMRDNRNGKDKGANNGRSVYITRDMGQTWTEHFSSRGALPEPVCMASLVRFCSKKDGFKESVLLFSNPDSKYARDHMTIKASLDEGISWPYQLLLYERPGFGYSCMTVVDEDHVGILYEGIRELYYEKISIQEILGDVILK